jgi:hypothetical protein
MRRRRMAHSLEWSVRFTVEGVTETTRYGLRVLVPLSYEQALERTAEALKAAQRSMRKTSSDSRLSTTPTSRFTRVAA